MSSDLMRWSGEGYGLARRQPRAQRELAQRAELDLMRLIGDAKYNEVRAVLRKRMTEDGMQDVTDVGLLARELASGDAYIAGLLVPIVQEFARTTARDIQDFGRGWNFR
ncbi:MAG TPA: hypothetical protein VFW65_33125 [Pseudonocardiaceae bacterium]|nr:hypothetical protein [Pseudonocardiaceae bacterium]